jgi:hypothetical protein
MYTYIQIYMYIHIYICTYTYLCAYIYKNQAFHQGDKNVITARISIMIYNDDFKEDWRKLLYL